MSPDKRNPKRGALWLGRAIPAIILLVAAAPAWASVTVTLTAPAGGSIYTPSSNITLTADASAGQGFTLSKVEFFSGASLIGTDFSAPYGLTWAGAPLGQHSLTAKATAVKKNTPDQTATSAAVDITVKALLHYVHVDHLNTPRLVADAAGTTVWRWEQQEPFGNNPANDDPDGNSVAFDLPLRLPGQRYDAETGLHHNVARNYWPDGGRYLEADPIGIATTTAPTATTSLASNLYLYALGRPTSVFDPDGREVQTCCGMTSALPDALVMVGLECMSTCLNDTILISSGTRTPDQNASTPGAASGSQHLVGLAADVHIPPSKSKIRRAAAECGFFVLAKDYPKHVHVDLRNGMNPKIEPNECVCQQIRSSP